MSIDAIKKALTDADTQVILSLFSFKKLMKNVKLYFLK